ncbi:MAG: hypothetical protein ABJB86_00030 [Bacteroidota bacterium]
MKYSLLILLFVAAIIVSCKKTNSSNVNVLFYNGTWSVPAITAAWNGNNVITTGIAQGQSSGTSFSPYLKEPAGTNLVTIKIGTDSLSKNVYAASSAGTSFLFYDDSSAAAVTGTAISVLQLTDDLTLPDTASINYRFINLSPDTSATVDVLLVNGTTDSLGLITASGAFIGAGADPAAVQPFLNQKYHGEGYTIKIKKSGTEALLASVPNYFFAVRGIYSIIFSGVSTGSGSTAFKVSVLHHFAQ